MNNLLINNINKSLGDLIILSNNVEMKLKLNITSDEEKSNLKELINSLIPLIANKTSVTFEKHEESNYFISRIKVNTIYKNEEPKEIVLKDLNEYKLILKTLEAMLYLAIE